MSALPGTAKPARTPIAMPLWLRIWPSSLPPWSAKLRPMLAPVLVAFLAFLFVVVHSLNRLAGEYAFLCYTSVVLFFFPRGRVSQQIENNTTNILGAIAGLGWSTAVVAVSAWCGGQYGADAAEARLVLGLGLTVLSMVCGTLRSYAPRLNVACRAAMFYPIFVLTTEQATDGFAARIFLHPFFVALFAYAFSTILGALLTQHASSPLVGAQIVRSVTTTCELLPMSLATILHPEQVDSRSSVSPLSAKALEDQPLPLSTQQHLAARLRAEVSTVRGTHAAYALDIVRARQDPAALRPVVSALGRLQKNPILGPTGHVPGERIRTALERTFATPASRPASRTSGHGTPSIRSSRVSLRAASVMASGTSTPIPPDQGVSATQLARHLSRVATHAERTLPPLRPESLSPARTKLTKTCTALSEAIVAVLKFAADDIAAACDWHPAETKPKLENSADHAECVAALRAALRVARDDLEKRLSGIIEFGEFGTPRGAGTPRSPATPLPVTPRSVVFEDQVTSADWLDDEDRFRIAFYMIALLDLAKDAAHLLDYAARLRGVSTRPRWIFPGIIWPWTKVTPEAPIFPTIAGELPPEQDDPEDNDQDRDFAHAARVQDAKPRVHDHADWPARIHAAWRSLWDRREVIIARVAISKAVHKAKHSRHGHFAVKQTIGIMLLSLPAFMPLGNAGRSWYDESRGPWMVVSFMFVIEVTTGATMKIGFYRMLGTLIGAVVGYVCAIIAGDNPYGLVTLATACAVPISYTILFTSVAPIGVITGITLPPIIFIRYLGLDRGSSVFRIAWERFVDIVIGIAAAVLIGTWMWPIHARVQYFHGVADTMDQITEYYLRMSRDLLRPGVYRAPNRTYAGIEAQVRRHIRRSRMLVSIQRQEISLLPRPVKLYGEVIDLTERLIETFGEIRTLRFSLPRKATVLDVLPIRRELVSSILMNLWATAQAFRSRAPLPQLLPSPRVPLGDVMEATDEHAHVVRSRRARHNLRRMKGTPKAEESKENGSEDEDEKDEGQDPHGLHAELSVLYGMAENEALGEAINSIDELLAAARTLFGTQAFLDVNATM